MTKVGVDYQCLHLATVCEVGQEASKWALSIMLNRLLGSTQNPNSDQGKPWRQTYVSIN